MSASSYFLHRHLMPFSCLSSSLFMVHNGIKKCFQELNFVKFSLFLHRHQVILLPLRAVPTMMMKKSLIPHNLTMEKLGRRETGSKYEILIFILKKNSGKSRKFGKEFFRKYFPPSCNFAGYKNCYPVVVGSDDDDAKMEVRLDSRCDEFTRFKRKLIIYNQFRGDVNQCHLCHFLNHHQVM